MLSSLLITALAPSHGSHRPCTAVTESGGCSPVTTHSLALLTVSSWKSLERSFSEIIRWQILTFLCRTIDPHTAQPCWPASWAQLSPTRAGLDKLLEHKLLIFIKPRVFVRLPYNNVCSIFQESFKKGLQGWVSYIVNVQSMLKDIVCNIWYCQLEASRYTLFAPKTLAQVHRVP